MRNESQFQVRRPHGLRNCTGIVFGAVVAALVAGLGTVGAAPSGAESEPMEEKEWFVDRAADLGLAFRHANGMTGEHYFAEMMGSGGALLDFDGDGDLDVYLVQGGPLEPAARAAGPLPTDQLFRQDRSEAGSEERMRFVDVTAKAGLAGATGYGMGVATGDFDGDGHVDLYLTNYGANQLWRNQGDGTFTDVTAAAGSAVGDPRWSVAASFFDADADGDLDLFVVNYVVAPIEEHVRCRTLTGAPTYCGPQNFRGARDLLLRNEGDGTFTDVTTEALGDGADDEPSRAGPGLGVVAADIDGDGWTDLYVANDLAPNRLWLGRPPRDGTPRFAEGALLAGVATSGEGQPEASMGLAADDLDGDGDLDLFATHLDQQSHTLYLQEDGAFFTDASLASGIANPSWGFTGFGIGVADFDGDGLLDLLVAHGAVKDKPNLVAAGDPLPLHESNQLFRGLGQGRFEEIGARAGRAFALSEVSRGVAQGDIDDDGDVDVLLTQNHGPARLLINQVGQDRPWLGLRFDDGSRLPLRVEVARAGATAPLVRRPARDGSYASAGDPRLAIGLGRAAEVREVRVVWGDGAVESFGPESVAVGAYRTLRRGAGRPVSEQGAEQTGSSDP